MNPKNKLSEKQESSHSRSKSLKRIAVCILILGPCLFAFTNKFAELIILFREESNWTFAITPIVNYLLASAGFICLFIWATMNGMFYDIEQPKHRMLANELMLEQLEQQRQIKVSNPNGTVT
jgi:hypothetical protein